MTSLEERRALVSAIDRARQAGARLASACQEAALDMRTYQRWKAGDGLVRGDRRPTAERPRPAHALTDAERQEIVRVANEPRFASLPPSRIVPIVSDRVDPPNSDRGARLSACSDGRGSGWSASSAVRSSLRF